MDTDRLCPGGRPRGTTELPITLPSFLIVTSVQSWRNYLYLASRVESSHAIRAHRRCAPRERTAFALTAPRGTSQRTGRGG